MTQIQCINIQTNRFYEPSFDGHDDTIPILLVKLSGSFAKDTFVDFLPSDIASLPL